MTLTEFETLVQAEAQNFELDEGVLKPVSPTARPHAKRLDRIIRYLITKLSEETYDILPGELGFILSTVPKPVVRGADLAVMYKDDTPGPGFVREAPLLVIEVVSPGNDVDDLDRKRKQYLAAGVREVWIVYEETKTIHVSQQADALVEFFMGQSASFECTLGFLVHCGEIFR